MKIFKNIFSLFVETDPKIIELKMKLNQSKENLESIGEQIESCLESSFKCESIMPEGLCDKEKKERKNIKFFTEEIIRLKYNRKRI